MKDSRMLRLRMSTHEGNVDLVLPEKSVNRITESTFRYIDLQHKKWLGMRPYSKDCRKYIKNGPEPFVKIEIQTVE
jgi:hypothetical protein